MARCRGINALRMTGQKRRALLSPPSKQLQLCMQLAMAWADNLEQCISLCVGQAACQCLEPLDQ